MIIDCILSRAMGSLRSALRTWTCAISAKAESAKYTSVVLTSRAASSTLAPKRRSESFSSSIRASSTTKSFDSSVWTLKISSGHVAAQVGHGLERLATSH